MNITGSKNRLTAAFEHIRESHPKVCIVFFTPDARWRYIDEGGEAPEFGPEIDTGILEDAQNWVDENYGFPAAFTMNLPEEVSK